MSDYLKEQKGKKYSNGNFVNGNSFVQSDSATSSSEVEDNEPTELRAPLLVDYADDENNSDKNEEEKLKRELMRLPQLAILEQDFLQTNRMMKHIVFQKMMHAEYNLFLLIALSVCQVENAM